MYVGLIAFRQTLDVLITRKERWCGTILKKLLRILLLIVSVITLGYSSMKKW